MFDFWLDAGLWGQECPVSLLLTTEVDGDSQSAFGDK